MTNKGLSDGEMARIFVNEYLDKDDELNSVKQELESLRKSHKELIKQEEAMQNKYNLAFKSMQEYKRKNEKLCEGFDFLAKLLKMSEFPQADIFIRHIKKTLEEKE